MVMHRSANVLLTAAEVAALFRVDSRTVARWVRTGRLPAIRTLGGRVRVSAQVVQRLLRDSPPWRGGDPSR